MIGRVVSTKMQNTVAVLIERRKKHPLYKKSFIRTKKYLVDDSLGAKLVDIVVIEKVRPISKRKHWKVVKVMGSDFVSLEQAELKQEAIEAIAEVLPEEVVKEESSDSAKATMDKDESNPSTSAQDKGESEEKKKEDKPKRVR